MKIELFKTDHSYHRVTITRQDGTTDAVDLHTKTYLLHDICHYCVEQSLNYDKGFWGMLAAGHSFSELAGKDNPMTDELRFIEKIVGPVQSVVSGHVALEAFPDYTAYLNSELAAKLPVAEVVAQINTLMQQWDSLSHGQSIALQFRVGKEG